MLISDETFFTLASNRKSLLAIAELFQLSEEELNHPQCGEWIKDCIKQIQTAQLALKAAAMRTTANQTIESYRSNPFPTKPNPLLVTPSTEEIA